MPNIINSQRIRRTNARLSNTAGNNFYNAAATTLRSNGTNPKTRAIEPIPATPEEDVSWGPAITVSTKAEAQAAINEADNGTPTWIQLQNDIVYTDADENHTEITIPANKFIKISGENGGGDPFAIDANSALVDRQYKTRVLTLANNGKLYLKDISIINGLPLSGNGGGIQDGGTCLVYLAGNVVIRNNVCGANGGGIGTVTGVTNAALYIRGNTIIENNVGNGGGGIYHVGYLDFASGSISANRALNSGGGIDLGNGSLGNIYGTAELTANICDGWGGAIYNSLNSKLVVMDNAKLNHNFAAKSGGAIFQFASAEPLTISGSVELKYNSVNETGGAIYVGSSAVISGEVQITHNTAKGNGGGIFVNKITSIYAGLLQVGPDVTFSDNKATNGYFIDEADIAAADRDIQTHYVTSPFEYAYNNYDISYTSDRPYCTNGLININGACADPNDTGMAGSILPPAVQNALGNILSSVPIGDAAMGELASTVNRILNQYIPPREALPEAPVPLAAGENIGETSVEQAGDLLGKAGCITKSVSTHHCATAREVCCILNAFCNCGTGEGGNGSSVGAVSAASDSCC